MNEDPYNPDSFATMAPRGIEGHVIVRRRDGQSMVMDDGGRFTMLFVEDRTDVWSIIDQLDPHENVPEPGHESIEYELCTLVIVPIGARVVAEHDTLTEYVPEGTLPIMLHVGPQR